MTSSVLDSQILMARQPIFDRDQRVVAYELLYRNDGTNRAKFLDGSGATSDVFINAFTSIADAGSIRKVPAFINLTYDIVVDGNIPDIPRKEIVLEILEDAEIDDALIEGVRQLVKQGFRIALDDFTYTPAHEPLLELAHIVKLDVLQHKGPALIEQMRAIRPFKVTMLAEKIETYEQLEVCLELGFKLFQGHFLSKPRLVKGRKITASQAALLQLLQELQRPSVKPEELEALIIQDPVLTYKLLRIVNSAAYSLVRQIETVSEAIVLLGMAQVKKWVSLIAMSANAEKPEELSRQLLIRGRMSEQIAEHLHRSNTSSYFMAGMMSGLDALLDLERSTMLEQVPLTDDIKEAIAEYGGDMGHTLKDVISYENGDWDLLPENFDADVYDASYREAITWTTEAMKAIGE